MSNRAAAVLIRAENTSNQEIVADSAEPKSIAEMYEYGLRVIAPARGRTA